MSSSNLTLILGGGFTGLFTALHMRHLSCPGSIVLVDRQDRFVFKPLLYDFLSGELNTDQVWPRYDTLLHDSGISFVQDTVRSIDLHGRQVELISGLRYTYTHLVLALGSTVGYFGTEGARENSFPFRTGEDAVILGTHLRMQLQRAIQTRDSERLPLLTVAVVGAGPAGVELSLTLADLLPEWYRDLGGNAGQIRVVLINRGEEILEGDINSRLRDKARTAMHQRAVPVEILSGAAVSAVRPGSVEFKRGEEHGSLQTATCIWTAGSATHPLIRELSIPPEHRDGRERLRVTSTLQLPDFPEVFAGGDCTVQLQAEAHTNLLPWLHGSDPAQAEPKPLPPTAQVAYQQGAAIARNLKAIMDGGSPQPAHIGMRGSLLKLGLQDGVANLFGRYEVSGKVGHLIRQGAYLELLPTPAHNFKATIEWLTDEVFDLALTR